MTLRRATCSCGQLAVTVRGEPLRVSVCHCLACQKRSGSAFAVQARFPADAVDIEGASTSYVRVGDAGGAARFHFCPVCGDTLFYRADAMPEQVAIPVGVFGDPGFPPPRVSVYNGRRHAWVGLAEDIERFD